jgi:hypothetical protein
MKMINITPIGPLGLVAETIATEARIIREGFKGKRSKRGFLSSKKPNVSLEMSTVNYLTSRSSNLAAFNTIQLNVSTLTGSTIQTTATANTSSIVVSTLTARAATYSTLTGSTITSNNLVLSTLTVSSINSGAPGVAAYSTFNASSINVASTITTSTLSTSGNITQASGTFFKNSATATSYMTMAGGDASNSPFMEFYYGGLRRCYIGNATASTFELYCQNNTDLNLYTGGSLRMVVSNAGNVGIGTNAPNSMLDIRGGTAGSVYWANPVLNVYGNTNYDGHNVVNIQCQASMYGRNILYMTGRYEGANDAWAFGAGRNIIMFQTQSSLNSAPTQRFQIQNFGNQLGILSNGKSNDPITVWNDNGNVGIGITNPGYKLHVDGTSKLGGIGTPFKSVVAFIATLGAGGAGIVQFTVTYPSAYTDASKLVINVTTAHDPAAAYDDTFGCTIRSVSTTSFILNLKRVDAASAWGANIRAHVVVYELT